MKSFDLIKFEGRSNEVLGTKDGREALLIALVAMDKGYCVGSPHETWSSDISATSHVSADDPGEISAIDTEGPTTPIL